MAIDQILIEKREDILRIAAKHGVSHIRVFGSAARGESRSESDLDLLVEVTGPTIPWFPGGLVAELEEFLCRRVDIVEPDGMWNPLMKQNGLGRSGSTARVMGVSCWAGRGTRKGWRR